jgi:hypothetical protein
MLNQRIKLSKSVVRGRYQEDFEAERGRFKERKLRRHWKEFKESTLF